jgi:GGDEF domain-containing protein
VTLLLFDIDDFKHYNDRHGHAVGDAILQQTAELIKRCVRDHDLVARIGGDEFGVVFWEKEGPRTPHDPSAASGGRFPRGPLAIANRFRRLMSEPDFFALGPSGKGSLSISGGMAVYPFDAQTAEGLIEAADRALIFGSKKSGKNSISLVGADPQENSHDELRDEE